MMKICHCFWNSPRKKLYLASLPKTLLAVFKAHSALESVTKSKGF